ncbi:MAG: hypothetical protein RLO51_24035 [Thalassobaculum sp.]|uniref:hypothetical protein n=1 Tax=Thalassobaculum sp. TaxID=2022740 RepID=UPI0032F02B49
MRWILVPAIAALLAGGPPAAHGSSVPPGDDPTINQPLTAMELAEWRIDRAVDRYGNGEFAAADRLLDQVVEVPEIPDLLRALALFNRGAARLQLARYSEAILDFDAAEALSFPRPAQIHLARGIAWENLRMLDRAAANYVDALSADPTDPSVRAKVRAFFYKP